MAATGQNLRRVFSRKGAYDDYYYMHRETGKCETLITEGAFLDNSADVKYIDTLEKRIVYYEAVIRGFCQYIGVKYKAPVVKVSTPQPKPSPKALFRVKVNGKQVGAFSNVDNITELVKTHVEKGEKSICIEKV